MPEPRRIRHAVLRGLITAALLGVLGVAVWAVGASPLLVMASFAAGTGAVVGVAAWLEARGPAVVGLWTTLGLSVVIVQAHFAGVWWVHGPEAAMTVFQARAPTVASLAVPISPGAGVALGLFTRGVVLGRRGGPPWSGRVQVVTFAFLVVGAVALTLAPSPPLPLAAVALVPIAAVIASLLVSVVSRVAVGLEASLWPE